MFLLFFRVIFIPNTIALKLIKYLAVGSQLIKLLDLVAMFFIDIFFSLFKAANWVSNPIFKCNKNRNAHYFAASHVHILHCNDNQLLPSKHKTFA